MKNIALFNQMISKYNELSFTHSYIFGFEFKGNIYSVTTDSEILPFILTLDKASRGAGFALRFKPTNEQKILMLSKGAQLLCSKAFFENEIAATKYNRGEIFEKMVTESFGQEWEKDNVPFTEDGDVTADGIAYQIKFEKATFTNEKFLAKNYR